MVYISNRNKFPRTEKVAYIWLIDERIDEIIGVTRSHSSKDYKENTDTFSIFASYVGLASANSEIIQLVDVESTSVVEKFTSIFKTLLEELRLSISIRVAPEKETKLSEHISEFYLLQSILSLATNECSYASDDTIKVSKHSHSMEQLELLLSTSLGYASNKNLKWPYDLSVHQVTQSSFHYYNVMVTESSIQKKAPPWKSDLNMISS